MAPDCVRAARPPLLLYSGIACWFELWLVCGTPALCGDASSIAVAVAAAVDDDSEEEADAVGGAPGADADSGEEADEG